MRRGSKQERGGESTRAAHQDRLHDVLRVRPDVPGALGARRTHRCHTEPVPGVAVQNCTARHCTAAARADQLLDEGDMAGAETWHRILNAIERLQAKMLAEG